MNDAVCEFVTVRLCGCVWMLGQMMTCNVMLVEAVPTELLATMVYTKPSWANWTLVSTSGVPVAPVIVAPLSNHWITGAGQPETAALNVPLLP